MPFPPVLERQITPVESEWRVLMHSGTKFVAGGYQWIMTSLTGVDDWVAFNTIPDFNCSAGAAKNDIIVLGGNDFVGSNECRYSSDGGASFGSSSMPLTQAPTGMATNGAGKFVAVTGSGAQRCCTSVDDGATWTAQAGFPSSTSYYWAGVFWDGTYFIAIGDNSFDSKLYRTRSLDGVTWSVPGLINTNLFTANLVTYWAVKGTKAVVLGRNSAGEPAYAYTTNSGATWTYGVFGLTGFYAVGTIAAGDDGFVAAGDGGNDVLAYSVDAITWLSAPVPESHPNTDDWSIGHGGVMVFGEYTGSGTGRLWTYGYPSQDPFIHFTFPVTQ